MIRKIVQTGDGSKTIQLPEWQEQYHSMHGAVQESYHVFLQQGLFQFSNRELHILEIGFGTGLNALITLLEAPSRGLRVRYSALEAFPLEEGLWRELDYGSGIADHPGVEQHFETLHHVPWESEQHITDHFSLQKMNVDLLKFHSEPAYDLIYFDAFGPRVQPELWTEEVFGRMFGSLKENGCLVTYSAKGSVRRAMESIGFRAERLPGPPGKPEMLRAPSP